MEITFGHPKDGRWDLKQFVVSMVTDQCGIPLFVQAHSGNKSDRKTLIETIQMFKSNLDSSEKNYFAADSAFFSSENIGLLGDRTLWITRVPTTVSEVKDFQRRDLGGHGTGMAEQLLASARARALQADACAAMLEDLTGFVQTNAEK
jgi:transposase